MSPVGEGRRGFTLVEVVVATLLLAVALTAVAGLSFLSARHLGRARSAEWAAASLASVADSLARRGVAADGRRSGPGGRITWRRVGSPGAGLSGVVLEARAPGGRLLLRAHTVLPLPPGPPP